MLPPPASTHPCHPCLTQSRELLAPRSGNNRRAPRGLVRKPSLSKYGTAGHPNWRAASYHFWIRRFRNSRLSNLGVRRSVFRRCAPFPRAGVAAHVLVGLARAPLLMRNRWFLHGSNSAAILPADDATPSCKSFRRILLHPLGELGRAHHARLHRYLGEIRAGNGPLTAISRKRKAAEHGDNCDQERASFESNIDVTEDSISSHHLLLKSESAFRCK